MADRTVSVSLMAKVQGYVAGIGTAVKATKQFSGDLDRLGTESPKRFHELSNAMGGVGLAMAGVAGFAVKMAADFDKQMSEVNAVSGATQAELGKLRQAALDAGAATQYSATQAAQAEAELAKAGLSTAEILGGALNGALALAAAGSLDLAEAADISAKAMNMFKLKGSDVGHIADLLAAAANKSATDVHELGGALKMGGLAAAAAGMSVEQTVGTLAAFADRALVGSDAGTSLKTALMMLQAPTEKSANLMRDLGIHAYDLNGNFIGTAKLAGILQEKLGGLTQEQRNAALAQIFGADAMRAANVLYELGEKGINEYVAAVDDTGAAADVAAKKTDNLAGDVERLTGSLETLAIEAGSGANGGLRTLVQMLGSIVDAISGLPPGVQSAGIVVAGLSGGALLAATGYLKLRDATKDALTALADSGPVGVKASNALGKVAAAAGRVGIALVAMQTASALMADDKVAPNMSQLNKDLIEFAKTGKAAGEAAKLFGKDLGLLEYDIGTLQSGFWADFGNGFASTIEGLTGLGGVADESLQHAKERLTGLDQALAAMVSSGHGDDARAVMERLRVEAEKHGVSLEELMKGLPQYQSALDGATSSQQKAVQVTEDATNRNVALASSWRDAVDAGKSLVSLFEQLNGAATNYIEAEMEAESAIDKFGEAIKASGGSLDIHTEKGRASMEALLGLAEAASKAAQAKYDETGSLESAKAVYESYITQLRKAMIAAGMNATEVDRLIQLYASMPKLVETELRQTRYETTIRQIISKPTLGNYTDQPGRLGGYAQGAILERFAAGGESHLAQLAPAGAMRLWAEPETGGEAYIPMSMTKRARSTQLLAEVNRRFGYPLGAPAPAAPGRMAVEFVGNTDSAFATAFMNLIRTNKIRVVSK